MRVLILRDTVANGAAVFAGEAYDLPDEDAAMLLRLRKATPVTDAASEAVPVVSGKPAAKRSR